MDEGAIADGDVDAGESDAGELDAGEFGSWLRDVRDALHGHGDSDVPCNGCTACCTSSQFVHIEPDEVDTLRHIPAEFRFQAPGLPRGHVVLGYDEQGRCPMLGEHGCSIYAHRPHACRVYDCRVYAATGVEIDEPEKAGVARRARRWRFSYASPGARVRHEAAQAAAAYLETHARELPEAHHARTATRRALRALEIAEQFVDSEAGSDSPTVVEPRLDAVAAALRGGDADRPSPPSLDREPERRARRTEG